MKFTMIPPPPQYKIDIRQSWNLFALTSDYGVTVRLGPGLGSGTSGVVSSGIARKGDISIYYCEFFRHSA